MTPLELALHRAGNLERFQGACQSALAGQAGIDLLESLLSVAHPLYPPEGRTPEEISRQIGRREIVALLVRQSTIDPATHNERPSTDPAAP